MVLRTLNGDEVKISYHIKAIELFGIIITTRKQLENCDIEFKKVDE